MLEGINFKKLIEEDCIQIACDFDGTISKKDTLDYLFENFADKKWLDIEDEWLSGMIGSRECMERQFNCLESMTKSKLDRFIDSLEIDDYFIDFYSNVKKHGIKFTIISDGFDYFIKRMLRNFGLGDIGVYSNYLKIEEDKISLTFANCNSNCRIRAANCKCSVLESIKISGKKIIFIGDGLSDVCVSGKVDIVFGKNTLANYCKEKNINFFEYRTFKDINNRIFEDN